MNIFKYKDLLIPYSLVSKRVDDTELDRFYIVDLTNSEIRDLIFKNVLSSYNDFVDFQEEVLSEIYYNDSRYFRILNNLVFKIPDDSDVSIMYSVVDDFEYMRKLFIKESYFDTLLSELSAQRYTTNTIVNVDGNSYSLGNFNLLEREDKEFLKGLSLSLKATFVTSYDMFQEYGEIIKNADYKKIATYYQKLWNMSIYGSVNMPQFIDRVSTTEGIMLFLASILSVQEKGKSLILDGSAICRLDTNRKLNLISVLNDYSYDNGMVIINSQSKSVNKLIKSRSYKVNIL